MSKKRVSYQNLLKQAISEFDTSKTVDVKGPMLDPILKWDGNGELPIYKDAASILERYYFNERNDQGVEVSEMDNNEDGTEAKTDAEKHTKGAGTEQAGTADASTISGAKEEKAEDIKKEEKLHEDKDEEEEVESEEDEDEDEDKDEDEDEDEDLDESSVKNLENAVIEKLIAEMEEEVKETQINYTGDDVAPGMKAPKEKEAKGPEEDAQGSGTEQAGTGTDAGQVPDRKDHADKFVKPKNYNEQDEVEVPGDKDGDKDEEDVDVELDVDEEVKEAALPLGPGMSKGEDSDDDEDVYEEAFKIFKEAIEKG